MEPDDKDLALRVKKGDRHSFDILFSRYKRKLYSVIYRMTRNHQVTDDMLQETFLKLYASISKYDDNYPFYPWLYRIAVNTTINFLKREKKRKYDRSLEEQVEQRHRQYANGRHAFDPETSLTRKERDVRILEAMQKISPTYRATLILRVFEGLSYKEISTVMNCNVGTVMSRLNRARSQLKELLKDYLKNGISTRS